MAVTPVSSTSSSNSTAAFGLDFQSMLNIILTQLTYQDPLKPLDNFEFISQLGQFAQLQQGQSLNDDVTNLLTAQSSLQATGLLGKTVDLTPQNGVASSGSVTAIGFSSGTPVLTVTTSGGQILTNISLADVTQIR
jgi:flagellar basal-body rod modification protein FlgD